MQDIALDGAAPRQAVFPENVIDEAAKSAVVTREDDAMRSSFGHFFRPTQQLDVESATGEQHVVECFADVAGYDRRAAVARDAGLRDAPHQLLDEGCTDPAGPPRGLAHDGLVERQTLAIEPNQLLAADVIRQRHLDRLVDAARTAGERALELLRPISGEDEQDVGVFLQSV